MSQETSNQITVEIDQHLEKTLKIHSEAKKVSQEEIAYDFMLTGAINDTTQKIIQTELYKGIETIRGDLKTDSDRIYDKLEQLEQQLDSLETTIEKVLEQLD